VVLRTAGTQSITATDISTSSFTATASITVNPAALDHLGITIPMPVIAGTAFTPTVAGVDPFGNVITSYQGTITFSSNDGAATLPSTYQFVPADNGSRAFPAGP
jgi:hypothetical protein